MVTPRIAPLPPHAWPSALRELLHASHRDGSGRENLFGTLAHHPPLAEAWLHLAQVLTHQALLEPRLRELVMLRTAHRLRSPFVRARHEAHARDLGVPEAAVAATAAPEPVPAAGEAPYGWSAREAVALRAVDPLAVGTPLPEAMWCELAGLFTPPELLELLVLVGQCAMACTTLNTLRTPGDGPTVRVDTGRCCSAGQCVSTVPEVFAHDEDGLVTLVDERPEVTERLRLAAALCPSGAIQLTAPPPPTAPAPAPAPAPASASVRSMEGAPPS
ncbi:4Fe-4S domain-containing protein [Streptomyces sp. NPDC102406]|uniref:4Fe-4S domain-containing protein n=1 Tax=Streptomyces sp. NPDC102406 TaxID=3366171 RepID=UPI00382830EA